MLSNRVARCLSTGRHALCIRNPDHNLVCGFMESVRKRWSIMESIARWNVWQHKARRPACRKEYQASSGDPFQRVPSLEKASVVSKGVPSNGDASNDERIR